MSVLLPGADMPVTGRFAPEAAVRVRSAFVPSELLQFAISDGLEPVGEFIEIETGKGV